MTEAATMTGRPALGLTYRKLWASSAAANLADGIFVVTLPLGRVNAGYRLFAWGTMPIGALLGGLMGELFGVVTVFVVAGLANLGLLVFRLTLTDAAIDAAELPASSAEAAAD